MNRKNVTLALTLVGPLLAGVSLFAPTSAAASQAADVQPMTPASTTLHLPDGKRTAVVWKTWHRNANGKYRGHYGFSSASKGVAVYAVLWTSDKTKYLPTEGKSYAYSNESRVQLFACYNKVPNGEDCTTTW
jgi:hypothetical protein